jgi:hypothetical protein
LVCVFWLNPLFVLLMLHLNPWFPF